MQTHKYSSTRGFMNVQTFLRRNYPGHDDKIYHMVDSNDINIPLLPFTNFIDSTAFLHFLTEINGANQTNKVSNAKNNMPKILRIQTGEGLAFPKPRLPTEHHNPDVFGANYNFTTIEEFDNIDWSEVETNLAQWLLQRSKCDKSHGRSFQIPIRKLKKFQLYIRERVENAAKNDHTNTA